MIKIIRGKFSPELLGPGAVVTLDKSSEERLVKRNVAVYVGAEQHTELDEDEIPFSYKEESAVNENEEQLEEDVFLPEEEIQKMSKDDLIMYGNSIGVDDLTDKMKKQELVDAILNYIEENSIEVEEEF